MKPLLLFLVFSFGVLARPRAQSYELQRLILDIEKLSELKNVLNNLYKGYQILSTGYNSIKRLSEGNFHLHEAFLDGLWLISPAVRDDQRVAAIIRYQARILTEYKTAMRRFRSSHGFSPEEMNYLTGVYQHLIEASASNTSDLLDILTARKLRMSDAERLARIDQLYHHARDQFVFLRRFSNTAGLLDQQRSVEQGNNQTLGQFYHLH